MGFSRSDFRPGMDVYTRDNHYLGAIAVVVPGSSGRTTEQVLESARQSSTVSGESMGPMPTQMLGNSGPSVQSARSLYATQRAPSTTLHGGKLVVGGGWGRASRTIDLSAVQTVSLERVNLKLRRDELSLECSYSRLGLGGVRGSRT